MEIQNLGNYASVLGLNETPKRFTYRRGYGNVVSTTTVNGNINSKSTQYNRLQPASGKFGNHNPQTVDPYFNMLNPQTNLAWDNTQPIPETSYQNTFLSKVESKDSTLSN